MKTDKNRTRLKDGQRVDVRVLGQILAAQNIDFVLPDAAHIVEFFAETLLTIPGISSCRVCLQGATAQKREMDLAVCKECPVSGKQKANPEDISPFMPDLAFTCRLGEQPGMRSHAIVSTRHHFGFFIFKVNDLDVFNVYQPFISNLANYVALSLENRLQRDLLQKSQAELEHKVEERTRDLITVNTQLMEEVETRRRAETALRLSEQQIRQLIEVSPVAMLAASGEDQRAEFVNEKFTELFGYTIEDIPDPEHWWPLAYPDEDYRERLEQVLTTGVTQTMEFTWVNAHGETLYLDYVIVPEYDQAGKISGHPDCWPAEGPRRVQFLPHASQFSQRESFPGGVPWRVEVSAR